MSEWESPLVLASGSARRLEILQTVGVPVETDPSDADESFPEGTPAGEAVVMLARRKAADVAVRHEGRTILAADTLVRVDDEILGKPADPADARRMLRLMSGRWHDVLTGVVDITPAEIDRYVAGPEPYDKAGGYGIQAVAGWFVAEIRGSYSNVMGLPLEDVRGLLAEAGLPLPSLGAR